MEIIKDNEGTIHETIKVKDIEGDMGEDTRLHLLQQRDGDVVLVLSNIREGNMGSIEFCTGNGGGRKPVIGR
ncbi:hypothetical protein LCGC14_3034170 [marine sediment metagenome]|uniref:Uncharacterized protein n=1 Tax=marine sediment metagenome TaxID=412755 RepID=A0A0F8WRA6_9ZZZZ